MTNSTTVPITRGHAIAIVDIRMTVYRTHSFDIHPTILAYPSLCKEVLPSLQGDISA